jgi:hypothetical protein
VLIDLDAPQFSSAEACSAAGIDIDTFKNWILRDSSPILLKESERRGGSARLTLSYRRVLQIALTAELVRLSIPPKRAAAWALGFTDVGDTYGGSPDEIAEGAASARLPGALYPEGLTLLVAHPYEEASRCINVGRRAEITDILFGFGRGNASAVLVNVNAVDRRVRAALDLASEKS